MKTLPAIGGVTDTSPSGPVRERDAMVWANFQLMREVARQGRVAKPCFALVATHSTVLCKLGASEKRLRTRLFERNHGRYVLIPAGHEIVQAAHTFEPLALPAETRVRGCDMRPMDDVRVAVAPILLEQLTLGVLVQFRSAFPDVRIELVVSHDHISLSRREADAAIRVADQAPQSLAGRKLATLQFKVFELRRGVTLARLRGVRELAQERRWIGFERDVRELKFRPLAQCPGAQCPGARCQHRDADRQHQPRVAHGAGGLGIAMLPAFLGESAPQLLLLTEAMKSLETPRWLLTHSERKNTMRIKVLLRAFGPALAHAAQAAQEPRVSA